MSSGVPTPGMDQSTSFSLLLATTGAAALFSFFWLIQGQGSVISRWSLVLPALLATTCLLWMYIVSAIVPEPYLDEVFHIPQAQKYCEGKFREWDDKITTPPGLYVFSIAIPGISSNFGGFFGACSAPALRATCALGLFTLAWLALQCRQAVEARLFEAHSATRLKVCSQYALHTAVNIAFFPLLFFFSGLYYTDVVSTATVLGAYLNHLQRLRHDQSSFPSDVITIIIGIVSLFMRQTNVFWVVVYMGGLEAVHAIKTLRPQRVEQSETPNFNQRLGFLAWRYSIGDIHDPPLHAQWSDDALFCAISLGIAALCNPLRVIRQIWPYVMVLGSFGAFVLWNGGVVLGDKSNHVATIHLAQMLYIWPLFAFFSLPLLLPYGLAPFKLLRFVFATRQPSNQKTGSSPKPRTQAADARGNAVDSSPARGFDERSQGHTAWVLKVNLLLRLSYYIGVIVLSFGIVKYNTIIHPFTLADNRHYMFYIFRYTIRRAAWIRYSLVSLYMLCQWAAWGTMSGFPETILSDHNRDCSAYYTRNYSFCNHPLRTFASQGKQTEANYHASVATPLPEVDATQQRTLREALAKDLLLVSTEPTSTSTSVLFLLATTLSLITAPLVEPRYFIIPWVMWRLLVPAWRLHDHVAPEVVGKISQSSHVGSKAVAFFGRYDPRLFVETLWFIAINFVTGYIFLSKPYQWKSEDGTLLDGGRLQRFMW